jgi:hypothetical protein
MTLNATVLGVQLAVDIISKIMSFGTMSTLSCILDAAALGLMIFAALYQRQVIDNLKKNLNA